MRLSFGTGIDSFVDKPQWQRDICDTVCPFTMTGAARIHALLDATSYIVANRIPGAFVECGVWRGGSMMAAALALMHLGAYDRDLFLFDTFSGMTQPSAEDHDLRGKHASTLFRRFRSRRNGNWCEASFSEVAANMQQTGYPPSRISLVQGDVMQTIPTQAPQLIALLRLDTDWYESTRHELQSLFDSVADYGVVIIDDYGHWRGARKAVDEFIQARGLACLLHRIDYTARMFVKTPLLQRS